MEFVSLADLRGRYLHVPAAALEHLLWTFQRMVIEPDGGRMFASLTSDLRKYDGPRTHFGFLPLSRLGGILGGDEPPLPRVEAWLADHGFIHGEEAR